MSAVTGRVTISLVYKIDTLLDWVSLWCEEFTELWDWEPIHTFILNLAGWNDG